MDLFRNDCDILVSSTALQQPHFTLTSAEITALFSASKALVKAINKQLRPMEPLYIRKACGRYTDRTECWLILYGHSALSKNALHASAERFRQVIPGLKVTVEEKPLGRFGIYR